MRQPGRATRAAAVGGRWLGFERLERRELLAVIRLVDWNTINGPNDALGDADFQTVLEAIGNETVEGNTKRLDILALQETDPAGPGGNSIGRLESILDALYPSTDYASVVSTEDGGGDAAGFVYDTGAVSLLSSIEVSPASLTHRVLRAKFRPSETSGESDFYVYSIHLKAGDTGADETTRGLEATVLRADADALGEGARVLFVGDFNFKDSFEAGYANLVAAGAGQVQDVADAPGRFFPAGDYNLNGVVDTVDYVVWRDTLGSTTDLRADGSGPSFGVPNGVVDQFDYDFWRANFGGVGVPGGGSGAGAGTGAGDAVTGAALSQPLVFLPSEPPQAVSDKEGWAVDVAVIDVALIRSPSVPAVAAEPVSRVGTPTSPAASIDLLLVVDRPFSTARRAEDSAAASSGLSSSDATEIDEFFATLGDWKLAAGAERS